MLRPLEAKTLRLSLRGGITPKSPMHRERGQVEGCRSVPRRIIPFFERQASDFLQSLLALRKPLRGISIAQLSQQPLDGRLSGGP